MRVDDRNKQKGYLNILVKVAGLFGVGLLWGSGSVLSRKGKPVLTPPGDLTSSHPATGTLLAPVSRLGLGPVPQTSHLRHRISDQGLEA